MTNPLVPKVVRHFTSQNFWVALGGENAEKYDGIFIDALLSDREPERQKRLEHIDSLINDTDKLLEGKEPTVCALLNYRLSALILQNIIKDGVQRNKKYEDIAAERLILADNVLKNSSENLMIDNTV